MAKKKATTRKANPYTAKQAASNRRALMKSIERDARLAHKKKMDLLRLEEAKTRAKLKNDLVKARADCAAHVSTTKERTKELFDSYVQAKREERDAAREAARNRCAVDRHAIRLHADQTLVALRAQRTEERRFKAEIARLEKAGTRKSKPHVNASEKKRESDEAVLNDIDPSLHHLWSKVKGSIKANERQSRIEAFLAYAEAHPREAAESQQQAADAELARMLTEEERRYRTSPRGRRQTEALVDAPF